MNPQIVRALALHLTGNAQGSFYFMSILTGWRIHGMALPMPDDVVDHIHQMGWQQKTNPGLLFADWILNSVDVDNDVMDNDEEGDEESSDDEDYVPNDEEDNEESSDDEDYVPSEHDDDESKHDDDDENNQNEENDVEPMANDTIDINADINLGCLVGSPGEVMPVENPGVEDVKNLGVEHENHDIKNPGVEDVESPGVEHDRAVENQDIASTENDKSETITNDQECTDNEGVENVNQGIQENESRYNLQRNHA